MWEHLAGNWPYLMVAFVAGVLGGLVPLIWRPRLHARSAVQHFAAGIVLAAIAGEVIPQVQETGHLVGVLGGFALGGLAMIGLKWVVLRFERKEAAHGHKATGLAVATLFDTIVDGVIIGAGFASGHGVGTLLALGLAVELFFLTLSVGTELQGGSHGEDVDDVGITGGVDVDHDGTTPSPPEAVEAGRRSPWGAIAMTTVIASMVVVGAVGALWLLADASGATVASVLAFGAAALLYLVAEELLVETPQAEHSLVSTATLFAGFLLVLALEFAMEAASEGAGLFG